MSQAADDIAFQDWMRQVDDRLADQLAGLTSDDLPDKLYRDAFDDGVTAADFADEIVDEIEGGDEGDRGEQEDCA